MCDKKCFFTLYVTRDMFDTHCHLNFKAFDGNVDRIIADAQFAGVSFITIPGTDAATSKKAAEIALQYENVYAAVGIHPHHVYQIQNSEFRIMNSCTKTGMKEYIKEIEQLLQLPKVVAVGEVGVDRHEYRKTKYETYRVNSEFIATQKILFKEHVLLALRYDKSLILHNREAKHDLLEVLNEVWDTKLQGKTVLHCCEPDEELLAFAQKHTVFIGVDGDVTYRKDKQAFVKKIPLDLLVLETDAPFLLPEPLRSAKQFPNEPKHIPLIAECVARVTGTDTEKLMNMTEENGRKLFGV